jgi:hypothetical protein
MIKVQYKLDEEKGLALFSFEGSREEDYEALDNLCIALTQRLESRAAMVSSNRLVVHFKGVVTPTSDSPTVYE